MIALIWFFILNVYRSKLYQEQNFNQKPGFLKALSLPLLESDQVSVPALIGSQMDTSWSWWESFWFYLLKHTSERRTIHSGALQEVRPACDGFPLDHCEFFLYDMFFTRSLGMGKRAITHNCQSSPRSQPASFPLPYTEVGSSIQFTEACQRVVQFFHATCLCNRLDKK